MKLILSLAAVLSSLTSSSECPLPQDLIFVQDTTSGLDDILAKMVAQIPLIYAGVTSRFPNSHIGLAEFQDKPYVPLGHEGSFCYKLAVPLTDDLAELTSEYGYLYGSGGGDVPEAQYQAIITAALDPKVGWRTIYDPSSGAPTDAVIGGRTIVLITDAVPHLAGDMAKVAGYPEVPQGLPANSGTISTDDVEYECLFQEYPSPEQVKVALQSTKTSLIILTPDDPAIVPAWTWVNSDLLGQPSEFYQRFDTGSSQLYEVIVQLLETATESAPCSTTTTTTKRGATTTSSGSTTTKPSQCSGCPCVPSGHCVVCPPECDAAVVVRVAKEPKNLQVIVNNE